jgi:hypothetical protein
MLTFHQYFGECQWPDGSTLPAVFDVPATLGYWAVKEYFAGSCARINAEPVVFICLDFWADVDTPKFQSEVMESH